MSDGVDEALDEISSELNGCFFPMFYICAFLLIANLLLMAVMFVRDVYIGSQEVIERQRTEVRK